MDGISIGYGGQFTKPEIVYMRNFLEGINKCHQGGLTLKDLKLNSFESNEKSKLSFRQWSEEFSSRVERIDQDLETLLRLVAQMQEWDKDRFVAEAQREYRLGAEKIAEFDKHIYLAMKRLTAGMWTPPRQQEKLGTESPTGFSGRDVQGATANASQLHELKRPTQIAESFHSLNVIRKLVKEFARQSPKDPMPRAFVKAACMRVVPETFCSKVDHHNLEDKVLAFIRNNTSGAAPMTIGNIAPVQTQVPGPDTSNQSTTSSSQGRD